MDREVRKFFTPSPAAELSEAHRLLHREDCPRRYCWWWHSLQFDFHLAPSEGRELAERWPRKYVKGGPICCRASHGAKHKDHYEPRAAFAYGWLPRRLLLHGRQAGS